MSVSNNIVIIGAGPYGLSVAAHLSARGIGYRIFGKPMANWQQKMPRGMLLKSSTDAPPPSIITARLADGEVQAKVLFSTRKQSS